MQTVQELCVGYGWVTLARTRGHLFAPYRVILGSESQVSRINSDQPSTGDNSSVSVPQPPKLLGYLAWVVLMLGMLC
jgi:hypothetical protein